MDGLLTGNRAAHERLSERSPSQAAHVSRMPITCAILYGFARMIPPGTGCISLCIACHVQDGQVGEALAVGLGHRPAIGPRQADVGQQHINGDPGLQESQGLPAAGRFRDLEPDILQSRNSHLADEGVIFHDENFHHVRTNQVPEE